MLLHLRIHKTISILNILGTYFFDAGFTYEGRGVVDVPYRLYLVCNSIELRLDMRLFPCMGFFLWGGGRVYPNAVFIILLNFFFSFPNNSNAFRGGQECFVFLMKSKIDRGS